MNDSSQAKTTTYIHIQISMYKYTMDLLDRSSGSDTLWSTNFPHIYFLLPHVLAYYLVAEVLGGVKLLFRGSGAQRTSDPSDRKA